MNETKSHFCSKNERSSVIVKFIKCILPLIIGLQEFKIFKDQNSGKCVTKLVTLSNDLLKTLESESDKA